LAGVSPTSAFAHPPATLRLGDLEVCRLGFGAMRLPGPVLDAMLGVKR